MLSVAMEIGSPPPTCSTNRKRICNLSLSSSSSASSDATPSAPQSATPMSPMAMAALAKAGLLKKPAAPAPPDATPMSPMAMAALAKAGLLKKPAAPAPPDATQQSNFQDGPDFSTSWSRARLAAAQAAQLPKDQAEGEEETGGAS